MRTAENRSTDSYAFSVDNWRRPKTKPTFLMQLLREYLRQEMPLIQKNNIRMRF